MIDRVEFQKPFGYVEKPQAERKRQEQEKAENQAVRVELSHIDPSMGMVDYEDIKSKVERIKLMLQENTYEVSPEKILQGLEKFLSVR